MDGPCTTRTSEVKEYRIFFFFFKLLFSDLVLGLISTATLWKKQGLQNPLIYFLVSKISKCKLKYKSCHQIDVAQVFTAYFEKGKKLKIFSRQFSSLSFPIFLSFSEWIGCFCRCARVWQLLNIMVLKTLLMKTQTLWS